MTKWTDKPSYETNHSEFQRGSNTTFKGYSKRAYAASPLVLWWEEEDRKRKRDEPNEIDYSEVFAALKGVKNKWFKLAQENGGKFNQPFKKFDWEFLFKNRKQI